MNTDTLRLPKVHDVQVTDIEDGFVSISQHDAGLDYDVSVFIHVSQWRKIRAFIDDVYAHECAMDAE